jgi:hypothetical protein
MTALLIGHARNAAPNKTDERQLNMPPKKSGPKLDMQQEDSRNATIEEVERFLDLVARLIAQRHLHGADGNSTAEPLQAGSPGKKSKKRPKPSAGNPSSVDSVSPP